jgi:hypothetical protein
VGGHKVNSRFELAQMLGFMVSSFMLEFSTETGETRCVRVRKDPGAPLGEITVPEPGDYPNVDFAMGSPLKNLLQRFFRKH